MRVKIILALTAGLALASAARAQEWAPTPDLVGEPAPAEAIAPESAPAAKSGSLDGILTEDERERLRIAGEQTRIVAQEAGERLKAQAQTLVVLLREQYETELDKAIVDLQKRLEDLRRKREETRRRQPDWGPQNP
jgi:hypothetical protein